MPDDQTNYSVPVAARLAVAKRLLRDVHEKQNATTAALAPAHVPVEVLAILDVLMEIVEELAANKWTSGSVR